jgi:cobalt-zinc-cadmium efflux system membrane fusion protein
MMNKWTNRRCKKVTCFFPILAGLLLTACSPPESIDIEGEVELLTAEGTKIELSRSQFEAAGMHLGQIEEHTFYEEVETNGSLDVPPEKKVAVSSYFGGIVKGLKLLPGDRVTKGQVLFILENPEYVQLQQDYLEAKGQLAYLESDYQRQKNLFRDSVTSQKNFLKAEAAYTLTKVKMQSLARKLSLMNINPQKLEIETIRTSIDIRSPISGFITEINLSQGTFLPPSQTALTIIDTDHLHLELVVFESELPKIKEGQAIRFSIQGEESKEHHAIVHLVNKTVEKQSRTVRIHGHLVEEEESRWFTPGMYVEGVIESNAKTVAALPEESVVEVEGRYFMLMLYGSRDANYWFEKKEVKVGVIDGGYVEVLNKEEFNKDARFLTKGAYDLIKE